MFVSSDLRIRPPSRGNSGRRLNTNIPKLNRVSSRNTHAIVVRFKLNRTAEISAYMGTRTAVTAGPAIVIGNSFAGGMDSIFAMPPAIQSEMDLTLIPLFRAAVA